MASETSPRTPSPSRPSARALIDSPFSDYYTDSSVFSPDAQAPPNFATAAQKNLLTRLNRIGGQILRRTPSEDATRVLSRELDVLEDAVSAVESRTREGDEVGDSGIFSGDDDDEDVESADEEVEEHELEREESRERRNGMGIRMSDSPESEVLTSPIIDDALDMENKVVMDAEEAKNLIARVTNVASELRQRYEETKHMNDITITKMESASNEVLHLRSENEALRADLSFDHSELLFLKLQLKAVELAIEAHADGDKQFTNNLSKTLTDGLERWKADWTDVDRKFKARRAKYGMDEPPTEPTSTDPKDFNGDGHIKMADVIKAKMPKRIISIKRPTNARSFTAPQHAPVPMPVHPPTPPSLTTADGESDAEEEEVVKEAILEQPTELDSDAITTSDEDEGSEESDWEDESNASSEEEADEDLDDEEAEEVEEVQEVTESPKPVESEKTPWEELWDSLTDFVGIHHDDDE